MSWVYPGMFKSTSSMEMVSKWNLSGLCLGATFLLVPERFKSFDYVTSSNLKWSTCSQTWVFLLMGHLEILQILKRWTHLRNGQVNKASSINSGLAKICLVVNNWSWIGHCWLWVALICFHFALVRFDLLAVSVQLKDKYLFSTPMKIHTMIGTVRKQENIFLVH